MNYVTRCPVGGLSVLTLTLMVFSERAYGGPITTAEPITVISGSYALSADGMTLQAAPNPGVNPFYLLFGVVEETQPIFIPPQVMGAVASNLQLNLMELRSFEPPDNRVDLLSPEIDALFRISSMSGTAGFMTDMTGTLTRDTEILSTYRLKAPVALSDNSFDPMEVNLILYANFGGILEMTFTGIDIVIIDDGGGFIIFPVEGGDQPEVIFELIAIPEPTTLTLALFGLTALVGWFAGCRLRAAIAVRR